MKIKNVELKFYAFIYDWNTKSLEWTNVLGDRYKEYLVKALKTKTEERRIKNRDELKENLRQYLFSCYASRAEYEVLVGDLLSEINPTKYVDEMVKIDVYNQVIKNLDVMVDYIINTMEIKFGENK